MYTHAMPPAPAPAAPGSAAQPEPRARACPVCGAALGGASALRCAECACGPFHRACALPGNGGDRRCPQCAQPAVVRVAGAGAKLGQGAQGCGDLAGARGCFERALGILEKSLPASHPHIGIARRNLESLEDQ